MFMKLIKQQINVVMTIGLILFAISGCGGKKTTEDVPPAPQPPAQALLTFPAADALCTAGTVISPTQASVVFTWEASTNTTTYDVVIKNLLTGTIATQSANTNYLNVTLLRNTPYSWSVVSKSALVSTTAQSETRKFYLAGSTTSYPPFPATITAPVFGESVAVGTVNLAWTGADVDNDIVGYDVYFGISSNPPLIQSNLKVAFTTGLITYSNATYYWRVITKDNLGNTSDSGIYQFITQ